MNRNEVKIDRLEIRLRGADQNAARELGATIGEQVLQEIASMANLTRGRRSSRIAQIDAGMLNLEADTSSPRSRSAIAARIAAAVNSRVAPRPTGKR
jgi:hypothetical protein